MSELVIAANRGPVSLTVGADGAVVSRQGGGGLAPSLAEALTGTDALFVAAAMSDPERAVAREGWPSALATPCAVRLVELSEETSDAAYKVVSNEMLWFLLHGLFDRAREPNFDATFARAFARYRRYNEAFAEVIAAQAGPGATVVVNDYHLALVGRYLAERRPDLATVHFSHTPFCTPEELAVLPDELARELVGGLAAHGACGFHTVRWADRFRACVDAVGADPPHVFSAPLGIDVERLSAIAGRPRVATARDALISELAGRRLILRSDRLELSKNLLRGFRAFAELLETEPEWRERVVFVARTYSSRADVDAYAAYRSEIERSCDAINARFGSATWTPIRLEVVDDFETTVAAMAAYDVLLVNPVRDGMNLVAKEGGALNDRDGVLVLSTEAGAYEELSAHVVAVNPFDVSGTARALSRALGMEPAERARRAAGLREAAGGLAPAAWLDAVRDEARPPRR